MSSSPAVWIMFCFLSAVYHKYFPQWAKQTPSGRPIKAASSSCITLNDFKEKRSSCDSVHTSHSGWSYLCSLTIIVHPGLHSSAWAEQSHLRVIHFYSLTCLKIGSVIKGMTSLPPWVICLQSKCGEALFMDLLHVWINIYFIQILELICSRLVYICNLEGFFYFIKGLWKEVFYVCRRLL